MEGKCKAGAVNDSIHTLYFFCMEGWLLLESGKLLGGLFVLFFLYSFLSFFLTPVLFFLFFFFFFAGCACWPVLLAQAIVNNRADEITGLVGYSGGAGRGQGQGRGTGTKTEWEKTREEAEGNDNEDSLALYILVGVMIGFLFFFLFFFTSVFYHNTPLVSCVSESSLIVGTCSLEDPHACLPAARGGGGLWWGTGARGCCRRRVI